MPTTQLDSLPRTATGQTCRITIWLSPRSTCSAEGWEVGDRHLWHFPNTLILSRCVPPLLFLLVFCPVVFSTVLGNSEPLLNWVDLTHQLYLREGAWGRGAGARDVSRVGRDKGYQLASHLPDYQRMPTLLFFPSTYSFTRSANIC